MSVAAMPLPAASPPIGNPIEKPIGARVGETLVIIAGRLHPFVRSSRFGKLYAGTSFLCFRPMPARALRPNIAFVVAARVTQVPDEGHVPVVPDLCVEVVSPSDDVCGLDDKLEDYEGVGVPLTWVFNPALRIVRVYRPGQPTHKLRAADTLDGGDVLPGFSAVVGELFPDVPAIA